MPHVRVLISGGFNRAYDALLPHFVRATGIQVTTGSGSSQGSGPQVIAAQLARGVPADVVILSREGLTELIAEQRIVSGTDVDLARTPIGVAVRAGAPKPDVGTIDALRKALLSAHSIAVPASTSGIFLVKAVFPQLGITDKLDVKVAPRGTGSIAMVASGEAKIALQPVSEIIGSAGVDFAGTLPEEVQLNQIFSAALVAGSSEIDAAKRLVAYLGSKEAAAAITKAGMEPRVC